MSTTYRIVRFSQKAKRRAVPGLSGLTLEQAREHCQSPESSSETCTTAHAKRRSATLGAWFDGYEKEQ